MVYWAIGLLVLGIILLAIEAIAPGFDFGITGILGTLALIVSSAMIIIYIPYGVWIVAAMAVILSFAVFLVIRYWKSKGGRKMVLTETLEEDVNPYKATDFLQSLIGKSGVTKTALRPHGLVDFSGADVGGDIEVRSDAGYVPAGARVTVVSAKDGYAFVRAYHE